MLLKSNDVIILPDKEVRFLVRNTQTSLINALKQNFGHYGKFGDYEEENDGKKLSFSVRHLGTWEGDYYRGMIDDDTSHTLHKIIACLEKETGCTINCQCGEKQYMYFWVSHNGLKKVDLDVSANNIVAVKSDVLDYSGDAVSDRKDDFSYRLYMSAGTVSDPSQLYPVLDEIEEGKIGLLSAKAEKLDAIVGQALPGFEKVSGLSVVKGKTDTYGLMGRYQNGSDIVSVYAKTDNKADNGYYEVSGHCDANHKLEVLHMVRHAELFHGLTVYNGLPTKENNLGLNDGSLLVSGVSKESDRPDASHSDDIPVVDFSDVGKKKGSTLSLA